MKVYTDGRVPVKSWADVVEQGALDQARNLANLPFAISHVALMPDAHPGFGMPIGGVLFARKTVVPGAIGVDIGCGVALLTTTLTVDDVGPGQLQRALDSIASHVPVGNGPAGNHVDPVRRTIALDSIREITKSTDIPVDEQWFERSLCQVGTLGGGNHFIEVQRDESGRVYVMVHSGSRGLGHKICSHYQKIALDLNKRWHSDLPDPDLAYMPWDEPAARDYWKAMEFALAWAETNRRLMIEAIDIALYHEFGSAFDVAETLDVHHNYAAWESHHGRSGIVHRKGAVRARLTDTVLIPGSMGTASYVAQGLGNPLSFDTCQHGAGRASGRRAFERTLVGGEFEAQMAGILLDRKSVV